MDFNSTKLATVKVDDANKKIRLDELMEEYSPVWRASPVHRILAKLGTLLSERRLHPDLIPDISTRLVDVVPGHIATISHVSGKRLGRRKGYYEILIKGPKLNGGWCFASGELEKLAQLAKKAD